MVLRIAFGAVEREAETDGVNLIQEVCLLAALACAQGRMIGTTTTAMAITIIALIISTIAVEAVPVAIAVE